MAATARILRIVVVLLLVVEAGGRRTVCVPGGSVCRTRGRASGVYRTPAQVGSRPGSSAAPGGSGRVVVSASMSAARCRGISARSSRCVGRRARSTAPCGAGRRRSASASVEVREVGRGLPDGAGDRELAAAAASGATTVDLVGDEPEPVAEVATCRATTRVARGRRRRPGGPGPRGRRCRAGGSPARAGRRRCDGQTSSMCAPRISSSPGTRW